MSPAPEAGAAVSKVDLAHGLIRSRIVSGEYTPGYRLVLGLLGKELGISSVPVREAVRRLEAEGLVQVERNVGATVRGLDPVEYRWTMETLAVVEGAAVAQALPFLDAAVLAEARRLNELMRAELDDLDPQRFTALNQRFHRLLASPCPNPHLLELVDRGWGRLALLRASVFSLVPQRTARSVAEHDALLDLIASGAAPEDVERAARAHRSATLRAVLDHEHA
ncbi:DNA-binding GntR family transcriptional regulator [Kineococcus xinjiangensis]|uniref:DNA-binding GntR family transcriptional regulator n=1 Tax=Kineococcus xinjiangensis TaxID=512762 RepID=A0A2S6IK68_9ACTN|nr:GntR family transcriptional regulator [Kineococcus xinjiangensis]PPK94571.1 DNA-binding GntR family transcriptional regulator [Kineococcus xinjiangensis]